MKKLLLLLLIVGMLFSFTACDFISDLFGEDEDASETEGGTDTEQNPDSDNKDEENGNTETSTKADEWRKTYDCITVSEALDICEAAGSTRSERYYVIATVVSVDDTTYGKMMVKDSTGEILVYGSYGADGEERYGELTTAVPKAGDVVLFYGNFLTYNGTPEMYSGWIIDFYTPGSTDSGNTGTGSGDKEDDSDDTITGTKADEWRKTYDCITIEETFAICDAAGETASERYYVIATVKSLDNAQYGQMMIEDSTGELLVYGTYGADGEERYGELTTAVPKAGDVVLLYGNFKNFKGTREMYSGWIIDFYTPGSTGSGNTGEGSGDKEEESDTTITGAKADEWRKTYDCITVSEALGICKTAGSTKSERYYVIATVVSVEDTYYGKMMVKDSTGEILVYGSYGADGEERYGDLTTAVPKAGDVVLFYGNFMTYESTPEMYSGWIIDFYTPGSTGSGNTGTGSGDSDNKEDTSHTYTEFTADEKKFITESIGFVIPFISCDEYYLDEYVVSEDGYSALGVNFYAYGNTQAEFTEYLKLFEAYTADYTEEDEFGDTWYYYSSGDVLIDVSFYDDGGEYVVDVYAYIEDDGKGGSSGEEEDTDSDDTVNSSKEDAWRKAYDCITVSEALDICEAAGSTKSERYYVIATVVSVEDTYYGKMMVKDSTGKILVYGSYGADGEERYGDLTTAVPKAGDVVLFYGNFMTYESTPEMYSGWIIDFYTPSGSSTDSDSENESDVEIMTNAGAGLPEDTDGVYDVDFTKADNVKDVTDQGYYLDGCPTTGSPAVLVIPVEFSDALASSKGYTTDALVNAFAKDGETDYYSLYDYYYISSYGQLTLDVTVLDFWFKPEKASTYYADATEEYYGEEMFIGDQLVLDEALAYLEGIMDLSKFDSDNNGIIDAVILVNTLEIGEEDFYWAYRYWNVYTDENEKYYEYDGVSANDYVWTPYQFLYESSDENGNVIYDENAMNTYTFIHEFGHILGADDYYDTEYVDHPMNGYDIMDSAVFGDHNAYTKINYGWITESRLVVTDGSITLTLEDFSKSGDTIIIATNWDEKLGAYQEYYVLVYYKNTGLNAGDGAGYFEEEGIVVYHVNASLYKEELDGEVYYDVYNTNTDPSGDYGTENNLVEFVKTAEGEYVYVAGDTLSEVTDDLGNKLGYTFTVVSLTEDTATVTFTAVSE